MFAGLRMVLVKQMDGTWLVQDGNFGPGPPPRGQAPARLNGGEIRSLSIMVRPVAEDNALDDPVAIEKQLRSEEERAAKRQRLA